MEWKYTKPMAYKTGEWDGKNSDLVLAEDVEGKFYLATFCEGIMDGSKFEEWYDDKDYFIRPEIKRWMEIPD